MLAYRNHFSCCLKACQCPCFRKLALLIHEVSIAGAGGLPSRSNTHNAWDTWDHIMIATLQQLMSASNASTTFETQPASKHL